MRLRRGNAIVAITSSEDYKIEDFAGFLASISAISGQVPLPPAEKREDRQKWEETLLKAIESVATRKQAKKGARMNRPKHPPAKSARSSNVESSTEWRRRLLVFADHYQFCLYDAAHDPFTPFPSFGEKEQKEGCSVSKHAIWYFTRAHRNLHRVDIGIANSPVHGSTAERMLVHRLEAPSGRVAIYQHEEKSDLNLAPGTYSIYTTAYNLGKEKQPGESADDHELLQRDDLERYEIVIVPDIGTRRRRSSRTKRKKE
jgi:hypothetical protein